MLVETSVILIFIFNVKCLLDIEWISLFSFEFSFKYTALVLGMPLACDFSSYFIHELLCLLARLHGNSGGGP